MKLKAFRVLNYKCIEDSDWIDIQDITVIVGKNESGKTALLKALHKFNPFKPEPYNLDVEWPRKTWDNRSEDSLVVIARFEFSPEDIKEFIDFWPFKEKPYEVEITKTYKGVFSFKFLPEDLPSTKTIEQFTSLINEYIHTKDEKTSPQFKQSLAQIQLELLKVIKEPFEFDYEQVSANIIEIINKSKQDDNPSDCDEFERINGLFLELLPDIKMHIYISTLHIMLNDIIPTFIFMDEHKPFTGSAYLDQINQRKIQNNLAEEDKTFLMLLAMAGLDFDKEVKRIGEQNKEGRMLDMKSASSKLTCKFADHWSQRNYKIEFNADGNQIIAFISDNVQPEFVRLDQRSKGFQWFFSFDATFLYETKGTFAGSIILLDEPGLHLHASAQIDLLHRIKEYAKNNQLIYTTHMPFMINVKQLNNIRVCAEHKDHGTKVTSDIFASDEPSWFPLHAALGISLSQSFFVGQYNLVVEGPNDLMILTIMTEVLREAGRTVLDDRIVITPSGGATKSVYLGTFFQGQKLKVIILLDSDPEGIKAKDDLVKTWLLKQRQIILLGPIIGRDGDTTIEDLYTPEYYLEYVNMVYEKKLQGGKIKISDIDKFECPRIIDKIQLAFEKRDAKQKGAIRFNKGSIAKRLCSELSKINYSNIPAVVMDNFENLFKEINGKMFNIKKA